MKIDAKSKINDRIDKSKYMNNTIFIQFVYILKYIARDLRRYLSR